MSEEKYKQLSKEERYVLEVMLQRGDSQKAIALALKRSASTISREIKRNGGKAAQFYLGQKAQDISMSRRSLSHKRRRLKSHELRYNVEHLICAGLSPQQISGRLRLERGKNIISHEAIYQWIYNDAKYLAHYLPKGRVKRQKYYSNKKCERIPNRVGIEERPQGRHMEDWEADLIVSSANKTALQVCVDRGSRMVRIRKISDKSGSSVYNAITQMIHKSECSSITYDNGRENSKHLDINKALGCKSYFCNAYHSWEKGSVENTNGVIRRYYPKKTNLAKIDEDELRLVEESLNNRPMKCLNWRTPNEIFYGYEEKDIMELATKILNPVLIRNQIALTP
jgi:IS30 family transposase